MLQVSETGIGFRDAGAGWSNFRLVLWHTSQCLTFSVNMQNSIYHESNISTQITRNTKNISQPVSTMKYGSTSYM